MSLHVAVRKRLREFALDVALEAGDGVTLIAGPSGSGKSTLLRAIAGLERIDGGRIALGESVLSAPPATHLPPRERDVALLFQAFALFPHLSVARNVAYGLEARKVPRAQREERVRAMLHFLDISALAGRFPASLSGGQQQRVALGRALVLRPKALLLDEPLASLDLQTRLRARRTIVNTLDALHIPSLLVSHDPADAVAFPARIAFLEAGRITARGSLDELDAAPPTPFVADYLAEVPRQGRGPRATKAALAGISEE
jgi:ABC-type sulfate/molybdate transport systems ATPase subunit